jgi:shikimate dehydrogenase
VTETGTQTQTQTPRRFAVVGDPVAHSRSPAMHMAAYRALGMPHVYEAIHTTADALPAVVARLRAGTLDGLNVTVPHKERVLALVDALDESARVAGAANTLVRDGAGRLVAFNTDAPALAAELRRVSGAIAWETTRALVLGSGGAARAAIAALGVHLGVRDIVVRARAFADATRRDAFVATAPCRIAAQTWGASSASEERTHAVVQATSAGMHGGDAGSAAADAVAWDSLPENAVAIDVVYAPRDTPYLRAARARGLRCDDGLGMLARQGALALELWLGQPAPLSVMRAALESR